MQHALGALLGRNTLQVQCPKCGAPDFASANWLVCRYMPGSENIKDYLAYKCNHCEYSWQEKTLEERSAELAVAAEALEAEYKQRGLLDLAPGNPGPLTQAHILGKGYR